MGDSCNCSIALLPAASLRTPAPDSSFRSRTDQTCKHLPSFWQTSKLYSKTHQTSKVSPNLQTSAKPSATLKLVCNAESRLTCLMVLSLLPPPPDIHVKAPCLLSARAPPSLDGPAATSQRRPLEHARSLTGLRWCLWMRLQRHAFTRRARGFVRVAWMASLYVHTCGVAAGTGKSSKWFSSSVETPKDAYNVAALPLASSFDSGTPDLVTGTA